MKMCGKLKLYGEYSGKCVVFSLLFAKNDYYYNESSEGDGLIYANLFILLGSKGQVSILFAESKISVVFFPQLLRVINDRLVAKGVSIAREYCDGRLYGMEMKRNGGGQISKNNLYFDQS